MQQRKGKREFRVYDLSNGKFAGGIQAHLIHTSLAARFRLLSVALMEAIIMSVSMPAPQ